MRARKSKYRMYVAVPIEVTAYDEINAESEVMRIATDYLDDGKPRTERQRKNWRKQFEVVYHRTQVNRYGHWESL